MRFRVSLLLPLFLLVSCNPTATEKAISRQLQDFPESRVQDIYKNFCQDALGPEHLIPDPAYARNYLEEELSTFREDLDSLRYEAPERLYYPVGDQGNYVRVDISVVLDGLVSEETLMDAFVRSANDGRKMNPEQWQVKWNGIAQVIRKAFGDIPDAEADLHRLDSLICEGNLIMHHSQAFREAYHPHYRIISRDIFENELKQLIDK